MRFPDVRLRLPDWVGEMLAGAGPVFPTDRDRMGLAIELARCNVAEGTGGPFGAVVFERDTGRLIAPGVNLVERSGCSAAHAEIVALAVAQQTLGRFSLRSDGPRQNKPDPVPAGARAPGACELVTSTEPCAMCLGAVPWSGVVRLICGAREADAREVGFDEGDKPPDWPAALAARGIELVRDCRRDEARQVLLDYRDRGGTIYNG